MFTQKKTTKTHDLKPLQNNKYDTCDPGADWDDLQTQEIVGKLYIYVIIFNPNNWIYKTDQLQNTVAGWNPAPVEAGSLSQYLQRF